MERGGKGESKMRSRVFSKGTIHVENSGVKASKESGSQMGGGKCRTKMLAWARIPLQSCSAVGSNGIHAQLPESSFNVSVGEDLDQNIPEWKPSSVWLTTGGPSCSDFVSYTSVQQV